ncbi:glutathione S-transferase zeta class-like [Silene latifolia]|uniref:glutathione S-transferase zeta class-like n=1 Tax=Silene latifolia TaxID=37657 RepID=UPI003D76DA58
MESATCPSSSCLVLYSHWYSSCSWRVRFALNLKGLPYEYKSVDLVNGEQYTPEFEKINPLHLVPILVDDEVVVADSLAILMYLEDKYPERPLLPADPRQKAISLQVASVVGSSMQPLHMRGVQMSIEKKLGEEEALLWVQQIINKGFYALETLLKDLAGKYSIGDKASMADVFLAPQVSIAMSRFHIDMSKYPTLNRVYESCRSLSEYQASLPESQPDARI